MKSLRWSHASGQLAAAVTKVVPLVRAIGLKKRGHFVFRWQLACQINDCESTQTSIYIF
jgi:hypothetical protein